MSAVLKPAPSSAVEAHLEPMTPERLPAVLAVEQSVYSHPWTRGNFTDTLAAGHQALCLLGGDELIGYFVAMRGFEEVHLLNITVAPAHQRQGWALVLLDALVLWSRAQVEEWVANGGSATNPADKPERQTSATLSILEQRYCRAS